MSSRLGRLFTSVALAATLTGGALATTTAPAFAGNGENCSKNVVSVVCTGDVNVIIANLSILDKNKIDVNVLSHIIEDAFNGNKTDVQILSDIQTYLKDVNVLNCLITVNLLSPAGCLVP